MLPVALALAACAGASLTGIVYGSREEAAPRRRRRPLEPYYSQGPITIYNARWEAVWPHLGLEPREVAACWADPPYGINLKVNRNAGGRWKPIVGDAVPYDPRPLLAVGFPRYVFWGANHYAQGLPRSPTWWTWDKREGMPSDTNADGEMAWVTPQGPARIFRHHWRGAVMASERGPRIHPTQKPVALSTWGFERLGLKRGDLVFVPYLGSGPELRSALDMGLRVIACEVDRSYCATAVRHRIRGRAVAPARRARAA